VEKETCKNILTLFGIEFFDFLIRFILFKKFFAYF